MWGSVGSRMFILGNGGMVERYSHTSWAVNVP